MRLDSANRSFFTAVGIALLLSALVLCGALGGVLLPLIRARLTHGGPAGLPAAGVSLLPALLFSVLITAGLTLAGRSLAQQILACRRLQRRVAGLATAPPNQLLRAARGAGLGGRVVLLDAPESFSFVYGLLTPRVALSRGLLQAVSPAELRAVLEHERYHVCNLDPLKVVLLRVLSAALFLLPTMGSLYARHVAGRELAADRRALALCGRRPLTGALLKVLRGPQWSELQVAAPIGGRELLDVRVGQLETGVEPGPRALGLARLALSLLSGVLLTVLFFAAVLGLGGPTTVLRPTATSLATTGLLGGLSCLAPFAGVGLLAYWLLARRAQQAPNLP